MKKILTVGVFDFFHYGHYLLLKRAKELGDYLIVAIQDSDYILKYKPDAHILYSTEQRVNLIAELKCVDEVIVYKDVDNIVKNIEFDIFVRGEDQNHKGFELASKYCKENNKEVVILSRTDGISSTLIKSMRKDLS